MIAISNIVDTPAFLLKDNIDTDQIIPKQFLKRIERSGFGEFLFFDHKDNPDWQIKKSSILITGKNFGCGSSREHAPWALQDFGIRAIIAESFADIFYSNCTKIGLLPITLDNKEIQQIKEEALAIDLDKQVVETSANLFHFSIDGKIKDCLLHGLDEISLSLAKESLIDDYEAKNKFSFSTTNTPRNH